MARINNAIMTGRSFIFIFVFSIFLKKSICSLKEEKQVKEENEDNEENEEKEENDAEKQKKFAHYDQTLPSRQVKYYLSHVHWFRGDIPRNRFLRWIKKYSQKEFDQNSVTDV